MDLKDPICETAQGARSGMAYGKEKSSAFNIYCKCSSKAHTDLSVQTILQRQRNFFPPTTDS